MSDKKSKSNKPTYIAYIMTTGNIEYFTDPLEAIQFKSENDDLIQEGKRFARKVDFERFKAKPPKSVVIDDDTKLNNGSPTGLTAAERATLEKCLETVEDATPTDRIEWHYKAHSRSTKAVGICRVMNKNGKDDWRVKGQPFAVALRAHAIYFPEAATTAEVQECFKNLTYAEQRDLEGNSKKVLTNPWTSTSGKKFDFPQHLMWTSFKLPPCTEFNNQAEENAYIEQVFNSVSATIKRMVKTESFCTTLERAINKPSIWASITKEGRHFRMFFEDCKIKVRESGTFLDHVVHHESNKIISLLYNSSQAHLKYPIQKPENTDDDGKTSPPIDNVLNTQDKTPPNTITPTKRTGPPRNAAAAAKHSKAAAV
jgi:hypothetical protein